MYYRDGRKFVENSLKACNSNDHIAIQKSFFTQIGHAVLSNSSYNNLFVKLTQVKHKTMSHSMSNSFHAQ